MAKYLPWHQQQWQLLQASREQNRLPHAILLTGPQGLGKQKFALLLAQSLLCQTPVDDGTPCDECRFCQLFLAGTHPDFNLIAPLEGKKMIAVDQVREIGQFMSLKSQYAGHKVVVITPAESMNINASNSLLKSLEEPSTDTALLLVTHQPAQLPATIRSRCQEIRFGINDIQAGRDWLAPRLTPEDDVDLLLALSQGAPLKALQLSQEGLQQQRLSFLERLEQLSSQQFDPVEMVAEFSKIGLPWSLTCLYLWTADMIRLKSVGRQAIYCANPDLDERLLKLANRVSLKAIFLLQDRIKQAMQEHDRNFNPSLIMESVLIQWQNVFRKQNRRIA